MLFLMMYSNIYFNTVIYMVRWPYFRGATNLFRNVRFSSSSVKPVIAAAKLNDIEAKSDINIINDDVNKATDETQNSVNKSKLIAAAFAPLKNRTVKRLDSIDESIIKATNPEQLLSLVDTCKLNRRHTMKIISTLADWSVAGDVDMKDFERDPRFTSLCQTLGHPYSPPVQNTIKTSTDDLTMVLNVKNDDEAAKIITTFTLQQMIKVLSSLALKKRRSVPLLRSLSFRIAQYSSKLDIKQGADILYALASLNYPDEILLEKVSSHLFDCIPKCKKTSVIGSISTSLGMLRYKDINLLDRLCEWTSKNLDICRNQDLNSVLFTLAHVNYYPNTSDNFFEDIRQKLLEADHNMTRLDVVWALTILNQATHEDYASVLSSMFYDRLQTTYPNGLSISCKKKLLNVNGAAKLSNGYDGPLIKVDEDLKDVTSRSKEKQTLVTSVFEALSNLLPSSVYLRTNVNLNMGFILDGECMVDSKMTPLPLVDRKTGAPLPPSQRGIKVAVFVWDYHEHTKGNVELCGVPSLYQRLAAQSGYRILAVPYLNFQPKDKLINRVKYLEKSLKLLVNRS